MTVKVRPQRAALVAAICATACLALPAAAHASLASALGKLMRSSGVLSSTSVSVFDTATGATIYSYDAGRREPPASNEKLLTSTAALAALGANYRFSTSVLMQGTTNTAGTVLTGNVYLRGGGDPTLSTYAFAKRHFGGQAGSLDALADYIAQLGIKRIDGNLVVDDTAFDKARYVASWKRSFRYYEAPALGALTVNHSYKTLAYGGASSHTPDIYAGQQLAALLKARGVKFSGTTTAGVTPASATLVGQTQSPPLTTIMRFMDTESDNFTAEILLKDLGWLAGPKGSRGSTAHGATVVAQQLAKLGVPGPFRIADGSGLSSSNRTSAAQITALLAAVDRTPTLGQTLERDLATSGGVGTLQSRLAKAPYRGRIEGKTGTLDNVSALSGFASSLSGHRYGFSAVTWVAHGSVPLGAAHSLQDAIAALLVASG